MPRLTDAERLLRSVPESQLQYTLRDIAALYGWPYFHDADSRRNAAGLPDTVLCVPPVLYLWELKTETGTLRVAQERWRAALSQVTQVDYRVVRPSTIEAALSHALRTHGLLVSTEREMSDGD